MSLISPRTIHSIVELPELVACIARYLSCSDVAQAMATCRVWSHQLYPFLWRHFSPRLTFTVLKKEQLLEKNRPLLRTANLKIESYELVQVLAQGLPVPTGCVSTCAATTFPESRSSQDARISCCTHLRRIIIDTDHRHELRGQGPSWPHLVTLLHHSHNLTHLDVSVMRAEPSELFFQQFLNAIPTLRRLQHFTFKVGLVARRKFMRMLHACLLLPHLKELRFDFSVPLLQEDAGHLPELETILKNAVATRASEGSIGTKIKTLKLPNLCSGSSDVLVLSLLKSGLLELEAFELPTIIGDQEPAYYRQFVRQYCPALRHLRFPVCSIAGDDGEMACNFIRGAVGLKTIRGVVPPVELGRLSVSQVIRTTLHSHARTLEGIEIERGDTLSSGDQQAILASCLQLKRLWLEPQSKSKPEGGLQFQDIIGSPWVCLGLRELCLTLDRSVNVKSVLEAAQQESWLPADQNATRRADPETLENEGVEQVNEDEQNESRAYAWASKRAYSQIGRLVNLQVLALGVVESDPSLGDTSHPAWDLTLSKGWLAEWTGLRNLRELHLRTNMWVRMGQAEVEFMNAHWPFLSIITFHSDHMLQGLVDQPHWRWLRERRPDLRYMHHCDGSLY
ncbi:hypothetical protein EC968_009657 [Mortierella alpina]|nr:hypothetical protein EC968_009657 [Mortierella alpina]